MCRTLLLDACVANITWSRWWLYCYLQDQRLLRLCAPYPKILYLCMTLIVQLGVYQLVLHHLVRSLLKADSVSGSFTYGRLQSLFGLFVDFYSCRIYLIKTRTVPNRRHRDFIQRHQLMLQHQDHLNPQLVVCILPLRATTRWFWHARRGPIWAQENATTHRRLSK